MHGVTSMDIPFGFGAWTCLGCWQTYGYVCLTVSTQRKASIKWPAVPLNQTSKGYNLDALENS